MFVLFHYYRPAFSQQQFPVDPSKEGLATGVTRTVAGLAPAVAATSAAAVRLCRRVVICNGRAYSGDAHLVSPLARPVSRELARRRGVRLVGVGRRVRRLRAAASTPEWCRGL